METQTKGRNDAKTQRVQWKKNENPRKGVKRRKEWSKEKENVKEKKEKKQRVWWWCKNKNPMKREMFLK